MEAKGKVKAIKKIVTCILAVVLAWTCFLNIDFTVQKLDLTGTVVATSWEVEAASKKAISVSKSTIKSKGAAAAINAALLSAKSKGTAKKPCTVKVAKGSYTLTNPLIVYSNTILNLTGVTLKRSGPNNIIRVGKVEDTNQSGGVTGYYYKNITIIGGTLNGNKKSTTVLKAAHVKNLTISGTTLQNTHNGHLCEIAGFNGVTFENCTFKNQTGKSGSGDFCYEAIQVDILQSFHMPYYRSQTLQNKGLTVTGCSFTNVPRGVGSHTSILNLPTKGVTISDCTFKKCKSGAIQTLAWTNVTITGNKITNCPRGITVQHVRTNGDGTYLGSVIAKSGSTKNTASTKYKTPTNQNIVISNNKITLSKTNDPNATYVRAGVLVVGTNIKKKVSSSGGSGNLPVGNYYVTGLTIKNNTITTSGYAIFMKSTRATTISGNTITFSKKSGDSTDYKGIYAAQSCKSLTINSNTIQKMKSHGIFIYSGNTAKKVCGNTIINCGGYGIAVSGSGKVTTISGNLIKSSGKSAIALVLGGKATSITNNVYYKCAGELQNGGSVSTLKNNASLSKISAVAVDGILYNIVAKTSGCKAQAYAMKDGSTLYTDVIPSTVVISGTEFAVTYNADDVTEGSAVEETAAEESTN